MVYETFTQMFYEDATFIELNGCLNGTVKRKH